MTGARTMFERTVRPVYASARRVAVERVMERRAGIHTEGVVHLDELGLDAEHRTRYKASGWLTLRRILPPREVDPSDVLLDLGAGMGRIVYQAAARYPFRRVIGVELAGELLEVARRNIDASVDHLRCTDVELVQADVVDYSLPDDVTIVYMYNPFTGPVFQAAVDSIVASLHRRPRRLRIIYGHPLEEHRLIAVGFKKTRQLRGMRPTAQWSLSNATRMYEWRGDAVTTP